MTDRMERLVVLPFGGGCVSQSSVAVFEQHNKKSKPPDSNSHALRPEDDELKGSSVANMKGSLRFLAFPRPNVSTGFHRLYKGFKAFSQFFVYKEEMEEVEMEIGLPTDVKHVTHIGWDGSASCSNPIKGWDSLLAPDLFSLPSVSFRH